MNQQRYLYDHGLPFSEKLGENVNDLVDRVKGNKAALILLDGGVGEGKTTLLIHIMDFVNNLYGFPPVNLELRRYPQLALGGSDFLKKLRTCYELKLPIIGYDEAGDFNRRGSLSRFNAMLNRTFETFRGFKILVGISLPSFHVLDNDIFDKNIPRLLLHLKDRDDNYGDFQGYSLYRMMYIKHKMGKLVVKPFAYDLVDSNFRGHFLNLPPKRAKQLDNISTRGKLSVLRKSEIKIEGLMGYIELAKKLERSVVWCRMAVGKLKIKPTRVINRSRYFDEDVLNRLADHLEIISASPRGRRKKE